MGIQSAVPHGEVGWFRLSLFGWGWAAVEILSSIFLGYLPTFVGSVSGAVWAFVDAFAGGVVMAILYNAFLRSRR